VLSRRARLERAVMAHQMRHAFGSGLMDAGGRSTRSRS
jgi:site-specific recombinase XerD